MPLSLADFDFELPADLIAQQPAAERSGSRLLHVAPGHLADRWFRELPDLLVAGDLLVVNDARVIQARFLGHKASGGKVEVLLERIVDAHEALAQVRASKSPATGSELRLAEAFTCRVAGRDGEFYRLQVDEDWWQLAERHGLLPLPPYITHPADAADAARYQTVFARHAGAVAAPTAGLHFDADVLERLQQRGIALASLTLHVGAGTFQPVRVERVEAHRMHSERYTIPAATAAAIRATRRDGGRIVAVGTTSLRALEASAAASEDGLPCAGEQATELFILPGYRFRVVDRLLTNFHLPKSTLLMLVSAFAGCDAIRAAYRHAISERYRFFSYGDAMLLEPAA